MTEYKYAETLVEDKHYRISKKEKEEVAIKILDYLKNKHRGKENAVTIQKMIKELEIKDTESSAVSTRAIMKGLIENGALIGGCINGYYYIIRSLEMQEVLVRINTYISGYKKREEMLLSNWRAEK
jgi:hypothetical protein